MAWSPQWSVVSRGQGTLSRAATMQEQAAWTTSAQAVQVAKECVFISTNGFVMPFMAAMMGANAQLILAPYVKSVQNPVGNGTNGDDGTWYPNAWYCHFKDGTKCIQTTPHNYVMESGYYTAETHAAKTRNGPLSGTSITGSYWAEYHIKDVIAKINQANAAAAVAGTHPLRGMWFDSEMLNSPQGAPGFFGTTNPGWNPHLLHAYTTAEFIAMATWTGDVAQNQVNTTINPERLFVAANGLQAGIEIAAHNDLVMWEGTFLNNRWNVAPSTQTSIQFFESRVQRILDCQLTYGTWAEPEEVGGGAWTAAQHTQARRFSAGWNLLANRGRLTYQYTETQNTAPHLESANDVALYGDTSTGGSNQPLDLGAPSSSPATIAAMAVAVGSSNGQASAPGLYTRAYDGGRVLVNATGLDGSAGSSINYKAAASYTLVPYPGAGGASYVAGNLIAVPARSAVILTGSGGTGGTAPSNTQLPELLGTPREGQVIQIRHGLYTGSPTPTISEQIRWSASSGGTYANISGATDPNTYTIPFGSSGTPVTYAADDFSDTEVDTWANADTGGAWAVEQGAAADFDKTSGLGTFSHGAANTGKMISLNIAQADADAVVSFSFPVVAAGGNFQASLCLRFQDTSNYLRLNIVQFATGGHATVNPDKVINGVATSLGTSKDLGSYTAAALISLRLRLSGTNLKGKAWLAAGSEPGSWDWDITDSSITAAGKLVLRSFRGASNTNTSPQTKVDNLTASSLVGTVGGYATDYLKTLETASNGVGSPATGTSAAFGPVAAGVPTDPIWLASDLPSVSGTPAELATLTADPGTVTSTAGAVTLAYQWQTSADATPASGSDIGGETAATHVPASGTSGTYRRAKVSATQGGVTTVQYTPWLGPLVATDTPPSFSADPAITGSTVAGQTLTATLGTPAGSPAPAVGTPFWQYSTDSGATYHDFSPAQNDTTYAEQATDEGHLIRIGVPLSNRAGSLIGYSAAVGPVTLPTTFPDLTLQVTVE